ncbi:MAG: PIN domain-containing protein [Candidatus Diapherotrites archaeon]
MNGKEKFLDSYAIIEIIKENQNYKPFKEAVAVTGKANLIEVAYSLLQDFQKETALIILGSLKIKTLEIEDNQITKIAVFKKEHAKKKFSYIDCIGYILAKENGIAFVTGDKEFEGMPNVEFVK